MFSRCLNIFFFCKFEQCWTKALFKHLKKTSQRHFRRFPRQTAKATYEDVFKISKTHLFWKSNQCLSTPLFRQLIQTSAICLGRISKTNQYLIFLIKVPLTKLETLTLDLPPPNTFFLNFQNSIRALHLASLLSGVKIW